MGDKQRLTVSVNKWQEDGWTWELWRLRSGVQVKIRTKDGLHDLATDVMFDFEDPPTYTDINDLPLSEEVRYALLYGGGLNLGG